MFDFIDQNRWLAAYQTEIARAARETDGRILRSVFFGGGTPSLMDPDVVGKVIETIRSTWRTSNDIEITLEANPSSVEAHRFRGYAEAGVNRVSLGVQALSDDALRQLGRLHSAAEARDAIDIAKAHFGRVSFDLIYARQNQSVGDWERELATALDMAADHLSLYQLTIEDGTAFGKRHASGGLTGLPDEDAAAEMFQISQSLCEDAGMPAYEVSNHAIPGSESRHNLIYWSAGDYIGIGPGAHGRLTLNQTRYATETQLAPMPWLHGMETRQTGESTRHPLSKSEMVSEYLLMGLRLVEGVRIDRLRTIADEPIFDRIDEMIADGWLAKSANQLFVPKQLRIVLNGVLRMLLRDY